MERLEQLRENESLCDNKSIEVLAKRINYNIMLIGFMGVGKSTVSAYLSQMLALDEVDIDSLIIEKEGMDITEIFEKFGEDYFRSCESNALTELQKKSQLVVSCGGGIVLSEKNVALMKKQGKIVLLTASPETIYNRVKDSTQRPLLNSNMDIPFITSLMERRRAKYESAADITIVTDDRSAQSICEELITKLMAFDA